MKGSLLTLILALTACRALPIAECTVKCNAGTCAPSLTCGQDGYCHGDGNINCANSDGGAGDGGLVSGGPLNYVFLTKNSYTPGVDFKSINDAHMICNTLAAASPILSGQYVVWLSDSTHDAKTQLGSAQGWIRPDGLPFARTADHLTNDGELFYPLLVDETGSLSTALDITVATATAASGSNEQQPSANNWTSNTGYLPGDAVETTAGWTDSGAGVTSKAAHLYCFGVGNTMNALNINKQPGRVAFVSKDPFDPSSGRSAADAQCQSEAVGNKNLPLGTYLALLSDTKKSAVSYFDISGPTWVRVDGIPWLKKASDLSQEAVLTSLNVDSAGDYLSFVRVWTGSQNAAAPSMSPAESCGDWSSGSMSQTAETGSSYLASAQFFSDSSESCSMTALHIYCLQNSTE